MKVFLSWSGKSSQSVALVLKDWLPQVIQVIEPYVSSEDIGKGERWSVDIAKELDTTNFGVLCVTKSNVHAPWLNFEAGALSKAFEKSRVSPFLLDIKPTDISGPLVQFQATQFSKHEVKKLLLSINSTTNSLLLPESRLTKAFETWWPDLENSLGDIISDHSQPAKQKTEIKISNTEKLLEEVLELVRSQHMKLSDPEQILPPEYVAQVNKQLLVNRTLLSDQEIESIKDSWVLLNTIFDDVKDTDIAKQLEEALVLLAKPLQSVLSAHHE